MWQKSWGYQSPMEVETIILRFRDLVTADNETINEHSAIIKEYGYVWWGWWKKGNEKTPFLEFSALSAKAKEKARPIYLLDSGQSKLFKATCADIQLKSESKFSSPEKDRTPVYYSNDASSLSSNLLHRDNQRKYASIAFDLWGHDDPTREWETLEEPIMDLELDKLRSRLVEDIAEKQDVDAETAICYFLIFTMDFLGYHI